MAELADLSAHGGLVWDVVLSGELVRAFKPNPAVYELALRRLRLDPQRVMMVAAHAWDLRAAAALGVRTAFVCRPGGDRPAPGERLDLVVADLAELTRLATP
jgi:2-haloacid dehalogenase